MIYDVKTMGFSTTYLNSSSSSTRPCSAVNMRARKVINEYRAKAIRLDRRLSVPMGEVGPVQARMQQLSPVIGLAVGPLCEISGSIRELLEGLVKKIAQRRGAKMVLHNCTPGQIESIVYDAIRRRLGLLMHTQWFELMMRSMSLVSWGTTEDIADFDMMEAGSDVARSRVASGLAIEGELGV